MLADLQLVITDHLSWNFVCRPNLYQGRNFCTSQLILRKYRAVTGAVQGFFNFYKFCTHLIKICLSHWFFCLLCNEIKIMFQTASKSVQYFSRLKKQSKFVKTAEYHISITSLIFSPQIALMAHFKVLEIPLRFVSCPFFDKMHSFRINRVDGTHNTIVKCAGNIIAVRGRSAVDVSRVVIFIYMTAFKGGWADLPVCLIL